MTEIGFYHLTSSTLEQALPRLLEKVLKSGKRAVLRAGSEERVDALNRQLWTYSTDSFLPHGRREDGHSERQPVFLTAGEENPAAADVLLVVDGAAYGELAAYERCLDLFDGNDPAAVEAARDRWRSAKAGGHVAVYWRQDGRGAWSRQEAGQARGGSSSA